MRPFRVVSVVLAALVLVGVSACTSVQSEAGEVAKTLVSLPSVVSSSADGNGMELNRDAQSQVSVVVDSAAPLADIEGLVAAWFRASADLPKTSLAIAMPAGDGDHSLQLSRSGYSESDLPAVVQTWFALTESYQRVATEEQSVATPGDPHGLTTIVDVDAATPTAMAALVADLRARGDDPGVTWWLHSVPDVDTAPSSITLFSRNELPNDDLVALLAGLDDAYAVAEAIGGMNLEVSTNYDGVYQVTVDINPDSLRDVPAADVVGLLERSDAWPVVRAVAQAIDPAGSVDVTFSILGQDAFAELDTTDCTKQGYVQYAALGSAVWKQWPGSSEPCS